MLGGWASASRFRQESTVATAPATDLHPFLSPLRGLLTCAFYPRLTPRALFWRRFAAFLRRRFLLALEFLEVNGGEGRPPYTLLRTSGALAPTFRHLQPCMDWAVMRLRTSQRSL
jgi:hypothetical protein